jgi:hypothetical protein
LAFFIFPVVFAVLFGLPLLVALMANDIIGISDPRWRRLVQIGFVALSVLYWGTASGVIHSPRPSWQETEMANREAIFAAQRATPGYVSPFEAAGYGPPITDAETQPRDKVRVDCDHFDPFVAAGYGPPIHPDGTPVDIRVPLSSSHPFTCPLTPTARLALWPAYDDPSVAARGDTLFRLSVASVLPSR